MSNPSNSTQTRSGLFPIPPLPEDLPGIDLTENARQVLIRRYVRRNDDGSPAESVDEMFWRVAYNIARVEVAFGNPDVMSRAREFYILLTSKKFFPNSPTFTGAGTPLGQLAACFVLPIVDDMGRDPMGIFQTLRDAALIQQTGGGNGFSFSRLRPKGTVVKSSSGQATGPVGFLRVYDHAFGEIAQGGTRRGANMGVLRVDHPDIEEFITCKTDENAITNFNISVGITDAFMRAVKEDAEWELRFPDVTDPRYRTFRGTIEEAEKEGIPICTYRKVRARDLFQKIVKQAHHNGEPGVLFLDAANRSNPVPHLYQLEATNPCGEQFLGPYENCCLGSINLAQHLSPNGSVDWEGLRHSVVLSTIFLDDVVEANAYVPAVPQLREAAIRARRIGLGIMGLADLMYHCGIRYGSPEGQEFAAQVMEFIRYHAMQTSIELAQQRGAFPAIHGSIYDPENLKWTPPQSIVPYVHDYGRPPLDWNAITEGIRKHGIRNAAQTTIAPTGTIATVAGCEGYGCEPVFALAYIRHVNDNGKDLRLIYASPAFEKAIAKAGIEAEKRQEILEQIMREGTCQHITDLPESIRNVFVVSADITAEEHVRMQAALQAFVDNSLSKTINFPEGATEEDVATAYMLAWELGCKGITVYVTGSREKVVLETLKTAEKKQGTAESKEDTEKSPEPQPAMLWQETKKPRPQILPGYTLNIDTPLGKTFVTVNENGGGQPFEVFLNSAKAGSDTAAVSEAIGRLISYILRMASPIPPIDRLREVIHQLSGIGGGRSLGFGPNRVRSLPDGIAQALEHYYEMWQERHASPGGREEIPQNGNGMHMESPASAPLPLFKIGDLCPECGQASVVNEEGCRKCYSCGYSEC
ncbi:adenosylcobalamin-dependent ribonucleoside-diphosphate reductase [Anaerolinea thermophila]|uniref:adenosylcobalamin-dependent ribonucleoside-diphosphate reductase n=1 Tax=Anaerolinea thermophila TaxID=167964 RepID=UPI0026EF3A36|nr:adenosylcobalamin-dependent ribonucleoside-diphosphate reductase [Anaerolinea thermophila]